MNDDERLGLEALGLEKVWAVVGASRNPERYGHEVLTALRQAGKAVLPVNPRYTEIDGLACYDSLATLAQKPDVVVLALAPKGSAAAIAAMPALDVLVWLPPGCWSEGALEACRERGNRMVHDVCPIGLLRLRGQEATAPT
jgi:predicted CoA-binding protein